MGTRKVNFRLADELVEQADAAAAATHRNRTEIVEEALRQYFQQAEDDEQFRESVVGLYLDSQISFDVLVEFIGRQDAEAVRASKEILEDGEELAAELADL